MQASMISDLDLSRVRSNDVGRTDDVSNGWTSARPSSSRRNLELRLRPQTAKTSKSKETLNSSSKLVHTIFSNYVVSFSVIL